MENSKLEIEKRYLLKNIPAIEFDEIHSIVQDYCPTGRIRHVKMYDVHPLVKQIYKGEMFIRTIKKTVSVGVNEEHEVEITKDEYHKELMTSTRGLEKMRLIKKLENHLKWEIDVFKTVKLVIGEIELHEVKDLDVFIPHDYIQAVLLADLTGKKEFSNFNLAKIK